MRRDELNVPLQRQRLAGRLWSKRPSLLLLAYGAAIAGFAAAAYLAVTTPLPFAGEPMVVAKIPVVEEITTASVEPAPDASPTSEEIVQTDPPEQQAAGAEKPAYTIVQPVEQEVVREEATLVVRPRSALTPAPVAAVTESTVQGPLPRIAANGKKPSGVYARTTSMNDIHSDAPKIAIILGGMGLQEEQTRLAARELPASITFAFAPYGTSLQKQVDYARKEGHEVLLQVPLEPIGFPASNPGPKTLLADAKKDDNIAALHWHMTRFAGYTGLVNYMGGRFLANPEAVKPLLAEVRKRGLLFIEDGSMPLTAVSDVAKSTSAPARRAHAVIDADPSPQAITAALMLLEAEAAQNGIAIATGSGLPETIDAIKEWAREANERGIMLIPASAAFKGRTG